MYFLKHAEMSVAHSGCKAVKDRLSADNRKSELCQINGMLYDGSDRGQGKRCC